MFVQESIKIQTQKTLVTLTTSITIASLQNNRSFTSFNKRKLIPNETKYLDLEKAKCIITRTSYGSTPTTTKLKYI